MEDLIVAAYTCKIIRVSINNYRWDIAYKDCTSGKGGYQNERDAMGGMIKEFEIMNKGL